jgi:light-regulated signal transduction histidine kinase (bacteriophytochrome)
MALPLVERRRADPQRDRIRLSVLAEVGLLFTSGGDEDEILRRVAEIVVPTLADTCSVLRSGATGLETVASQRIENLPGDVGSQVSVPLLVRGGDVIGVLVLRRSAHHPQYTHDDLVFAEELARRIAMHVDHARLLSDQTQLISQLEQSNRELDRFADVASHDLKAPLRGIGHLATWIEEDLSPFVTEGGRTHLQLLRDRVQRLEDMIDGILRCSRAGRIVDDPVEVDVRELTSEIVGLLAAPASASIVIDQALPTLQTVRIPLQQVLLNLVGNALAHASSEHPCVHVGGSPIDGGWEFFVRDDGKGIAAAHHEQIWRMFKTLRHRETASTGIGLSIVRRIVESVGGRAWVESELGEGATFRFTWPSTLQHRPWQRAASMRGT